MGFVEFEFLIFPISIDATNVTSPVQKNSLPFNEEFNYCSESDQKKELTKKNEARSSNGNFFGINCWFFIRQCLFIKEMIRATNRTFTDRIIIVKY